MTDRRADIFTVDCSDETNPNRWCAIMFAEQRRGEGHTTLVPTIFRGNSEQSVGDKAEAWWQAQMLKPETTKR